MTPTDRNVAGFKQTVGLTLEKQSVVSRGLSPAFLSVCLLLLLFFKSFFAYVFLLVCSYMAGDMTTNSSLVLHLCSGDIPRLKVGSVRPNQVPQKAFWHWSVKDLPIMNALDIIGFLYSFSILCAHWPVKFQVYLLSLIKCSNHLYY